MFDYSWGILRYVSACLVANIVHHEQTGQYYQHDCLIVYQEIQEYKSCNYYAFEYG